MQQDLVHHAGGPVTIGKRACRLSADGFSFLGERDGQVIHQEREGEGGLKVWGQRGKRRWETVG